MCHTLARLAALAILAIAGSGPLAAGASPARSVAAGRVAATISTYTSAAYRYSFSYPTSWTAHHAEGADIAVIAPHERAGFIVALPRRSEDAAALKVDLRKLLAGAGTLKGAPRYSVRLINGLAYGEWRAESVDQGGVTAWISFGTAHGPRTYLFLAGVDRGLPSTSANQRALSGIIGSLILR